MKAPTRLFAMVLVLLAVHPALAQQPPPPPDLVGLYRALETPTVIGALVGPRVLKVGRAEIQALDGARILLLAAGDRRCGLVVDGKAMLTYTVEDRFSIPVARQNLKRLGRKQLTETGGTLTLTMQLTGAAVWGWGLDSQNGEPRQEAGLALPGWLREVFERQLDGNPARDMTLSAWNGDDGYRWAVLHGSSEDLVLDVDPRPSAKLETLLRLEKLPAGSDLSGRLVADELAAQPIGRPWWEGAAVELVSTDTELSVKNPKGELAEVQAVTRIQSLRDGIRLLPMALVSQFWDERLHPRAYSIRELTVDGQPAPYVHRKGALLVALPRPLVKGETVTLAVAASGQILPRPRGDNYWALDYQDWYPKPSLGGAEWAEFRITAECPAPFVPFAAGDVVERAEANGVRRVSTRLRGPMRSASVLAGRWSTVTEENAPARVHVSGYAFSKEEEARRLGRIVLAVRSCLEQWLGEPYPFADLHVVEVNDWGFGLAPPGMIFITKEAFLTQAKASIDDETEVYAGVFSRGVNERIAHEVAHGWFPHVAKVVSSEEHWLSESLAEYTSACCLQRLTSDGRQGSHFFERQLRQWRNWSKDAGDDGSVFLANHISNGEDGSLTRHYLLYGRGPLVLHSIRQELIRKHGEDKGEQLFRTWIRSYVRNHTYKAATTRNLIGILSQITGEDWQGFFERHIYGVEPPRVK